MKVWLTQTILAQFAEILPQNGPVGAKHVVNGTVFLKISAYLKGPPKAVWENLVEIT